MRGELAGFIALAREIFVCTSGKALRWGGGDDDGFFCILGVSLPLVWYRVRNAALSGAGRRGQSP